MPIGDCFFSRHRHPRTCLGPLAHDLYYDSFVPDTFYEFRRANLIRFVASVLIKERHNTTIAENYLQIAVPLVVNGIDPCADKRQKG